MDKTMDEQMDRWAINDLKLGSYVYIWMDGQIDMCR